MLFILVLSDLSIYCSALISLTLFCGKGCGNGAQFAGMHPISPSAPTAYVALPATAGIHQENATRTKRYRWREYLRESTPPKGGVYTNPARGVPNPHAPVLSSRKSGPAGNSAGAPFPANPFETEIAIDGELLNCEPDC